MSIKRRDSLHREAQTGKGRYQKPKRTIFSQKSHKAKLSYWEFCKRKKHCTKMTPCSRLLRSSTPSKHPSFHLCLSQVRAKSLAFTQADRNRKPNIHLQPFLADPTRSSLENQIQPDSLSQKHEQSMYWPANFFMFPGK